jgi:uncharacterized damage-inducible protein DinB
VRAPSPSPRCHPERSQDDSLRESLRGVEGPLPTPNHKIRYPQDEIVPELNSTLATALTTRYQKLSAALHDQAAPLTDDEFWRKPFPFGNSVGHLLLHLTGNLNYYVGAEIAHTGYIRDRPQEFSTPTHPAKQEVLSHFDEAIKIVLNTIHHQSEDDWSKPYAAKSTDAHTRLEILLICATHLHHHIGQIMYLTFELQQNRQ